jgi:hypothetical protein
MVAGARGRTAWAQRRFLDGDESAEDLGGYVDDVIGVVRPEVAGLGWFRAARA